MPELRPEARPESAPSGPREEREGERAFEAQKDHAEPEYGAEAGARPCILRRGQ